MGTSVSQEHTCEKTPGHDQYQNAPYRLTTSLKRLPATRSWRSTGTTSIAEMADRFTDVRAVYGDYNHDGRTDIALVGGAGWNTSRSRQGDGSEYPRPLDDIDPPGSGSSRTH
jgi:hypothetical protein